MTARQLDGLFEASHDDLNFALWYLKQRSLVTADDKSRLQITVAGIDAVDHERPQADRILPFIKGAPRPMQTAPANVLELLSHAGPEPATLT